MIYNAKNCRMVEGVGPSKPFQNNTLTLKSHPTCPIVAHGEFLKSENAGFVVCA